MPYTKTNWVDKTPTNSGTPVNADNLNKIEQGIEDVTLQTEQHITDSDIHVTPEDKIEWDKISEVYKGEIYSYQTNNAKESGLYKVRRGLTPGLLNSWLLVSAQTDNGVFIGGEQLFLSATYTVSGSQLRQRRWNKSTNEWGAWEIYAYQSDLLPILQDIVELQEEKLNKTEAHQTFANAIIGTASGETVTLSDVQEGTSARSLKIYGDSEGVESATVTVNGKNLFYAVSGNTSTNHGMTRTYDLQNQTMTINGTATQEAGHIKVLTTNFKFKAGKSYKLRAFVISGTGSQTVTVSKGDGTNVIIILSASKNYIATYTPEVDSVEDVTAGFYWYNGTTADNLTVKLMISEVDVDEYEPYKPTVEYPLSFDPPLYEGDSYDLTADQVIPLYSPTTIISTDQGSLEVEYNRDINTALSESGLDPADFVPRVNQANRVYITNATGQQTTKPLSDFATPSYVDGKIDVVQSNVDVLRSDLDTKLDSVGNIFYIGDYRLFGGAYINLIDGEYIYNPNKPGDYYMYCNGNSVFIKEPFSNNVVDYGTGKSYVLSVYNGEVSLKEVI